MARGMPFETVMTMQRAVEFKGFQPAEKIRSLIERLIARLARKNKRLPEPVFLRLAMEEIPPHRLYTVSITLDLPGKTLAAKEQMHDPEAAIRAAFEEIERQVEAYKATSRGEQFWKQLARRRELRRMKTEQPFIESDQREAFFSLVSPHLERLNHFVRHVIRFAEAHGDLIPGELTAADAVDATLLRAYDEFRKNPPRGDVRSWLIRIAAQQVAAEIKRSKRERGRVVYMEEEVPNLPPPEDVTSLGEEILYFYQPDEDLKLEDLVPDLDLPTPEQNVEIMELRRCVRSALVSMPQELRRVLVLRYVQELEVPELAGLIGKPVSEVERVLEEARAHLRQKLIDSGCSFHGSEGGAVQPAQVLHAYKKG